MTPTEARAEASRIIRASAADFTRQWIADQRTAGHSLEAVAAEIRASEAEAAAVIEAAVVAVTAALLRREEAAFVEIAAAARARGAFAGWPTRGWLH